MGFGFQIGMGLATYIMTAALYLLLLIAALSRSVPVALVLGAVFGVVVWPCCSGGKSSARRRCVPSTGSSSAAGAEVRLLTIAVEGGCAVSCAVALWAPLALALGLGAVSATGIYLTRAGHLFSRTTASQEAVATATATPRA